MVQEKRKEKRIKEDFSILCRVFRKIALDGQISRIINLSKSGMAFLTDYKLTKNDILQIALRLPPHFQEKAELFGRVVDSSSETQADFKVRVTFIDIDPSQKLLLNNLIEQTHLKEKSKKES